MDISTTNDSNDQSLASLIRGETVLPIEGPAQHWIEHFREVPGVAAVLFYGSGLWKSDEEAKDVIFDFYLLVDRFRDFDPKLKLAMAGTLVPPNVYYREETFGDQTLRCKFAVLTVTQFLSAARGRSFTPHIWARFCQPCRISFAVDDALRRELVEAIAYSVVLFHHRTLHLVDTCDLSDFWRTGLQSTYADEIRSEKKGRLRSLFEASEAAYTARTSLALAGLPDMGRVDSSGTVISNISALRKQIYRIKLYLKRPLSKSVIVCRLIKAVFTFQGGLDYGRWKVEKHSGVRIEITDFHRRHPILGGLLLFLEAKKRGGLR